MPPPMPNPTKRMTANPLKPVRRYRPGKPVAEEASSGEEDVSEEETQQAPPPRRLPPSKPQTAAPRPKPSTLHVESEDEEGFVTEEEEEEGDAETFGATKPTPLSSRDLPTTTTPAPSKSSEEGESEEESEEETEESSSEDERPKFLRPTFIKKAARTPNTCAAPISASNGASYDDAAEKEQARRKEMANLMIKDKLERDAAARAAGKKSWDHEEVPEDMVDDTDGVDPDAEYAAWKLRELKRLKRDREAIEAREKEIEELERRRNLTQAERDAEDAKFLSRQKEEREEGRGKAGYLQRYHHKGAFFQDDETAEVLRKRDLMGAKFVDEVQNREALPQFMQIRDMSKLGKKGRTRYTDLRGEDTGRWGDYARNDRKGGEGFKGVYERFQPDRDGGGKAGPTGANASVVRERRVSRSRERSPRRDGDRYRPDESSRKRTSPSPYHDRDKRRRVEAI